MNDAWWNVKFSQGHKKCLQSLTFCTYTSWTFHRGLWLGRKYGAMKQQWHKEQRKQYVIGWWGWMVRRLLHRHEASVPAKSGDSGRDASTAAGFEPARENPIFKSISLTTRTSCRWRRPRGVYIISSTMLKMNCNIHLRNDWVSHKATTR